MYVKCSSSRGTDIYTRVVTNVGGLLLWTEDGRGRSVASWGWWLLLWRAVGTTVGRVVIHLLGDRFIPLVATAAAAAPATGRGVVRFRGRVGRGTCRE